MGKYDETRAELKASIVSQFKSDALASGEPDTASLNIVVDMKSEKLLEEFERLAHKREKASYWYGVGQSVIGGLLVFPILALFAFTLSGFKVNVFRVLWDDSTSPAAVAGPTPSRNSPSPSPSVR